MKASIIKQEAEFGQKLGLRLNFADPYYAMTKGRELPGITLNISEFQWQNLLDAVPGRTRAEKMHMIEAVLQVMVDRLNKP